MTRERFGVRYPETDNARFGNAGEMREEADTHEIGGTLELYTKLELISNFDQEIVDWEGTENFYLYLVGDEELEGTLLAAYILKRDEEEAQTPNGYGVFDAIRDVLHEAREEDPDRFEEARETATRVWHMPEDEDKARQRQHLERDHLKPLLRTMTPLMVEHGVVPEDMTR